MSKARAGVLAVLIGMAAIGALHHADSTGTRSASPADERSGDSAARRPASSAAGRSVSSAAGRPANPEARHFGRHEIAPIVIAHRGASAFRPEHTLLAYTVAISMGADYIEPDLVSTKDHVLVARHENELSATTDIARHPEFADRMTSKVINGIRHTGWFTEDFTLEELRTLRARERFARERRDNTAYDGIERIPTLDEVVQLAQRHGVGVYAETKFPTYFASIGLPLEGPLLETFARYGWDDERDPAFIQSFEPGNLRRLRPLTRLRLVQFVGATGAPYDLASAGDPLTYDDMVTPEGLREVATYADAVGVVTKRIGPGDPGGLDGRPVSPVALVRNAQEEGLLVHATTVRKLAARLRADLRGDASGGRATEEVKKWLKRLYRLNVDGVIADDPGLACAIRDRLRGGG
ncbi:glycerophosphodiester phosphodiesterase family protein [Streptosporangium sp. NBC_01469]|uniref:glycerophosphodiester phosphodiesterase family protein n=1 Tax=Streptosporangium sp. NBC_01469 TaxID=2903898 RepID=UPI002E295E04|nr:glycerophosphodiester phosphodiesterase family protein [Streptosporangium sp. NBC_01469]